MVFLFFESVNDGSTSIRKFFSHMKIDEVRLNAFLNKIGITYKSGRIISKKNIEVFSIIFFLICSLYWQAYTDSSLLLDEDGVFVNIFDGFFHTWFFDIEMNGQYKFFMYELLENHDALNSAKVNPLHESLTRVRMDVYPE